MEAQTPAAQMSVAADEGTLKRSIQMKFFASKSDKAKVTYAFVNDASKTKGNAAASSLAVGQVVGAIYAVKEQMGTLPNGEVKKSLLAIGDFEATNYSTGEVITSTAAYLPGYYLETVATMLDHPQSPGAIMAALEIVLVPTGKEISVAYEVKNLIRRRADNPVNRIKQELAAANRLRLPAPVASSEAPIPGEILAIADQTDEPAGDPSEEPDAPEPDAAAVAADVAKGRARAKADA